MDKELRIKVLEDRLKLFKSFVHHSVKGVRCPGCGNFVPESCRNGDNFICPYPGCMASCKNGEVMSHPATAVAMPAFQLNSPPGAGSSDGGSFDREGDRNWAYCDDKGTPYDSITKEEDQKTKFRIIHEIIESQKKVNGCTRKLPSKGCMYDAFLSVLRSYPVEMIRYICVGGQNGGDFYIQSVIFQEFIKNMAAKLPIIYYSSGDEINISSLHDERLHIFNGVRQFTNYIDSELIVKKRLDTKATGDEFITDDEDTFIGSIISVIDEFGNDITTEVDSYNFMLLKLKPCAKVVPGSSVTVKFNSIQPSYTLGAMIHLQRIKKKIKESSAKKIASFYNTINLGKNVTTNSDTKDNEGD